MAQRMPALGVEVGDARLRNVAPAVRRVPPEGAIRRLVKEKAAPYYVRWVRRFLTRPAANEPLADRVWQFCDELARDDRCQDWQVQQAQHALRMYFVNFLHRADWRQPSGTLVDENGCTNPLAALEELRRRIRTRHYSYRTECSYADWVRRFFGYCSERQGVPAPRIESDAVLLTATIDMAVATLFAAIGLLTLGAGLRWRAGRTAALLLGMPLVQTSVNKLADSPARRGPYGPSRC